jgi:hypothetical protein
LKNKRLEEVREGRVKVLENNFVNINYYLLPFESSNYNSTEMSDRIELIESRLRSEEERFGNKFVDLFYFDDLGLELDIRYRLDKTD